MRSLINSINPGVERPTAGNQTIRPLINAALLAGVALATAALAALWAWLAGPPAGPLLTTGAALYALQSVTLAWPPVITWRPAARRHKRAVVAVGAFGLALTALWLNGDWPTVGRVLFWNFAVIEGVWHFAFSNGYHTTALEPAPLWWAWLRVALLGVIPALSPVVTRLWWRYSTEIVAPSVPDSLRGMAGRVAVPGLAMTYPVGGAGSVDATPYSAQPEMGGDL